MAAKGASSPAPGAAKRKLLVRKGLPYRLPDGSEAAMDQTLGWTVGLRELEHMLDEKLSQTEWEQRSTLKVSDWVMDAKEGEAHLEVFLEYIQQCTCYKPFLMRVHAACMRLITCVSRAAARITEVEDAHSNIEEQCKAVTRSTIKMFDEKVEKYRTCVHDAKREVEHYRTLHQEAQERQAELQKLVDAEKAARHEDVKQVADYQRMAQESYANLRALQQKSQDVMEENGVLRKVALYNEDLLREIEERKDEADHLRLLQGSHDGALSAVREDMDRELVRAKEVIHSLTQQRRMHDEELTAAQSEGASLREQLAAVTAERDTLLRSHTPRPVVNTSVIDSAASTRDKVTAIVTHNTSLSFQVTAQKAKLQAAEAVASFIKADMDYYALSFEQPLLGGRPLYGLGVHPGIPVHLRHYGPVRNRHFTPTETRTLLHELAGWVDACGDAAAAPATLFEAWLRETKGRDLEQLEVAYSLIDAGDRMVNAADIRVFKRWLEGSLPLHVYTDCARFLAKVLDAFMMKTKEGKSGRTTLKRKVVSDLIDGLFKKQYADAEYLRLKHALTRDMKRASDAGIMRKEDVPWETVFFSSDEHGNALDTVSVIREQYIANIDEMNVDVDHIVYSTGVDYVTKHNQKTTRFTSRRLIARCLAVLDPVGLCDEDAAAATDRLLASVPESIHDDGAFPFALVAGRARGLLAHHRTGKPVDVRKILKTLPQAVLEEQRQLKRKLYPSRAAEDGAPLPDPPSAQ